MKPAADKQAQPTTPAAPAAGQSPAARLKKGDVEMAGIWAAPDNDNHDEMGGARFKVTPDAKPKKRINAAPGMGTP
jgi:hypothetical protein